MWTALGDTLPFAVGLALSPFAIVTGIVLLLGHRGTVKTSLFGLGWFGAIAVLTAVALFLVDTSAEASEGYTETGVDIVQIAFAVLFLALAVVTWVKQLRSSRESSADSGLQNEAVSKESKLLARLDSLSVLGALGIGVVQGLVVIKNIPLALSAGAAFGEAHLGGGTAVAAVLVFAAVATLGVIVPLLVAVFGGARVSTILTRSRSWIEANMSPITITVLLVLGAVFFGRGLGVLD